MEKLTDVSSIVDSSQNIDGYERDLLKKLFYKLEENQKNIFDKIEKKVKDQVTICPQNNNWHISTALIENDKSTKDQAKRNGYYEIVPLDNNREVMRFNELKVCKEDDPDVVMRGNVYAGVVFLNCKYSEMISYKKDYYGIVRTDDDNQDYEIKYNLIPFEAIMEQEKYLEQTALQYGIEVPLLYSPMSRRAMIIKVDLSASEAAQNNNYTIDFQYKKNQLDRAIINNKTLVWNVLSEDKSVLPHPKENVDKKVTTAFDKPYVIYSFGAKENEYYYVHSENLDIRRINGDIFLGLDRDSAIEQIDYQRFTIHSPSSIENNLLFENKYGSTCCVKQRVRTKGDIHNVLSCFDLCCESISFSGKHNIVHRYDNRYSYHYPKDEVLHSNSVIYVKVRDNGDLYFEDYVSYVFAYLDYYYPEFRWVGVY